jgi:WD40 repeat protein
MSATSLASAVRPLTLEAHVTAAAFLGETAAFALGDGAVVLARGGATHRVDAHPGGSILVATAQAERLLTGGDDGRVAVTGSDGSTRTLAETGGAWIDALAVREDGAFAFAAGRKVVARDDKGREKTFTAPSTARGLAFAPKGYRLAIAHYNGVTLWFPNLEPEPEFLEWKGSHLDVTWSADARFVVSTMQESALHGWRLQPERGHMRMTGYPAKTRSLSWSHDGLWLATSGADAAIIWPFAAKDGPMGKAPRECGVRTSRVSRVAFHPKSYVLAVGYEDGFVMLIRLADGAELLVRPATKSAPVTALAWDARGDHLAFGCADGAAGLLTLPK